MELQVGVKALIKNSEGKYLFLKRREVLIDEKEPSWTIPGGRINSDEPIKEGLKREIKEETGLTLTGEPHILYAQDIFRPHLNRHIVRLTFLAEAKGTIDIDHDDENDHQEFKWMSSKEIKKVPLEVMLKPVLKFIK